MCGTEMDWKLSNLLNRAFSAEFNANRIPRALPWARMNESVGLTQS